MRGVRWGVLAFLYLPLLVLVLSSFNASRLGATWGGFTGKWYRALLTDRQVHEALVNSLEIALVTTAISTVLGTMAALGLHRMRARWRRIHEGALYLPILVPDLVLGISLLVLFARLHVPLGKGTMIVAHVTFSLPFVVLTVLSSLRGVRREWEEAAADLGATPWQTFCHVILPLIWPGILAGALMVFTLSLDDFLVSFFVSGPGATTLPLYIYGMVKRGITPEIYALSTVLIVVTVILILLAEGIRRRADVSERRGAVFETDD